MALAALIQGFGGADTIAFAAQFAFRGGGAGALLVGTRLGFRLFLSQLWLSIRENFIDTGAESAQQSGVLEARCHGPPLILGGFSYG